MSESPALAGLFSYRIVDGHLLASFDLSQLGGCILTTTPDAIRVHDTRK